MSFPVLFALASALVLQDQSNASASDTVVSVNVTRTMRVTPDSASMYVLVEGIGETPNIALDRLAPRMGAIRDTLRRFGKRVVAEKPLPVNVAPVQPQPVYPPPAQAVSFAARGLIRIVVGVDDVALVQAAMYTAGASGVSGFAYESAVPDSLWRAHIAQAAEEARSLATSLASAQGKRLGPLIEMNAGRQSILAGPPQLSFENRYGVPYGGAPEVSMHATVWARYRLLPR